MPETLMSMLGPFVMGVVLGIAYTRGACMTLNIRSYVWGMALVLLAGAGIAIYSEWNNIAAGSVLGVGLCLVLLAKLAYMRYRLPFELAVDSLAARAGEEEPGLGLVDGLWVMCYSSGQMLSYDRLGKLKRITFPDGSQWELCELKDGSD